MKFGPHFYPYAWLLALFLTATTTRSWLEAIFIAFSAITYTSLALYEHVKQAWAEWDHQQTHESLNSIYWGDHQ